MRIRCTSGRKNVKMYQFVLIELSRIASEQYGASAVLCRRTWYSLAVIVLIVAPSLVLHPDFQYNFKVGAYRAVIGAQIMSLNLNVRHGARLSNTDGPGYPRCAFSNTLHDYC
jgi:hypothetical protein